MAAKNGGSGFDADKFRKLVAMFDSNYVEEAVTAFRLAVAELKKKQGRFCDQLVDSDEARELAEIECAKVRDELTRILDQCARREADVDDADEIIDRLHERIAEMEKKARAKAKKYTRNETTTDRDTPPSPDETDMDAPEDWDDAAPPPFYPASDDAAANDPSGHEPAYRHPALPVWKSAYWLGLLSFVVMYAGVAAGLGHMVTVEEWRAANLTIAGAFLFAVVISLYVMGWKWGFSQTRFGQWCVRNAGSVGDMLAGLFVVIFIGCMAYGYFLATHEQIDEIGLSLFGIVGVVFAAFYLQQLLKTFGWAGVGIKALMWLDFYCIGYSLLVGDLPGWRDLRHHHPITQDHAMNALYFWIVWGLFMVLDRPTHWAIRYKTVREIVTLPALFFLAFGSVEIADYAVEGQKPQPSVIEQSQPSHAKPKRGAFVVAPPHSPVLLATALLTPQPYRYQPYRYQPYSEPKSNAEIVRGWCRDLKSFFDELLGKEVEEWIIGLIALRWLWKAAQKAKDRRIKRRAIERALNPPPPPNIYGNEAFADRGRAKKGGWL
jgi:hypothetical protein